MQFDNPANSLEEWSKTSSKVFPATEHLASIFFLSSIVKSPSSNSPSTNNFNPLSVGILPEDVWGECKYPCSSNLAITDLMLEGDKGELNFSEINFEDTGVPCLR